MDCSGRLTTLSVRAPEDGHLVISIKHRHTSRFPGMANVSNNNFDEGNRALLVETGRGSALTIVFRNFFLFNYDVGLLT